MSYTIAILEDNVRRIERMKPCLTRLLPDCPQVFFESAHEMITWLAHHQGEVGLIALDHDLPLRRSPDGQYIDFGTGRLVAEYLAGQPVTCPVIVHSSNDVGAVAMVYALEHAGWPVIRVYPCDDMQWVDSAWAQAIHRFMAEGWVGT